MSVVDEMDDDEKENLESLERARADVQSAMASDPSILVVQLESWRLYEDWSLGSYVPTYHSGWSPKRLTLQDGSGRIMTVDAETNAGVGDLVNIDDKEEENVES